MSFEKGPYLDDQQVGDGGDVGMHASLSSLANFFSDHDSLAEEVLVDSIALLLGHKHLGRFFSDTGLPVL